MRRLLVCALALAFPCAATAVPHAVRHRAPVCKMTARYVAKRIGLRVGDPAIIGLPFASCNYYAGGAKGRRSSDVLNFNGFSGGRTYKFLRKKLKSGQSPYPIHKDDRAGRGGYWGSAHVPDSEGDKTTFIAGCRPKHADGFIDYRQVPNGGKRNVDNIPTANNLRLFRAACNRF